MLRFMMGVAIWLCVGVTGVVIYYCFEHRKGREKWHETPGVTILAVFAGPVFTLVILPIILILYFGSIAWALRTRRTRRTS